MLDKHLDWISKTAIYQRSEEFYVLEGQVAAPSSVLVPQAALARSSNPVHSRRRNLAIVLIFYQSRLRHVNVIMMQSLPLTTDRLDTRIM